MKTYFIKASQTVFCPFQNRNVKEKFSRSIKAESKAEAIHDLIELICDEQEKTYSQIQTSIQILQINKIK